MWSRSPAGHPDGWERPPDLGRPTYARPSKPGGGEMSTDGPESRGHDAAPTDAPRDDSPASAHEPSDTSPLSSESPARPRRSRVLRRVLISVGILGLVLAVAIGGGLWYLSDRWGGNIDRISDAFAGLDENSRPAPATPAVS